MGYGYEFCNSPQEYTSNNTHKYSEKGAAQSTIDGRRKRL